MQLVLSLIIGMQFAFEENERTLLEDPGDSITPAKQFRMVSQEK